MVSKTASFILIGLTIGLSLLRNSRLANLLIILSGGRAIKLVKDGVNITNSTNTLFYVGEKIMSLSLFLIE